MERNRKMSWVKPWTAAIAAGILTSLACLPYAARGELVYENNAGSQSDGVRMDDRAALRQTLNVAERERDTQQAETASTAQAPAAPAAPTLAQADPDQYSSQATQGDSVESLRNMNKAELMRRERVREELRNEDALQERLEELRLRDEKRRTDQILGVQSGKSAEGEQAPAVTLPTPLYGGQPQEEVVSSPVTDHPGEVRQAPTMGPAAPAADNRGVQLAGVASVNELDQAGAPSQMTASVDLDKPRSRSTFYVSPRAGLGTMTNSGGLYDINPHFAGGVAVGVDTSDYLSFELGYTYAEYGVNIASGNPMVQQLQAMQYAYGTNTNSNTLTFKQNVIEVGLKLHLLDKSSIVRPFIGGGGAWSKGYINYDQSILNILKQYPGYANNGLANDYELTSYLGYVSGGLDVKMNQSITVGLMAKYYAVLSSSENSSLNNYAFYNSALVQQQSPEKQVVGGSIAKANFFTIMGNVSFAF
jgi:hypothetical protein